MGVLGSGAALLLIAVLITVHEFGHFIVAKALGVRVTVFSIGIGPRLVGIRIGETDYRLSGFLFGGYVRFAGADPFLDAGVEEEDDLTAEGAFMGKPVWKRLLIVAAGPAMNLVLPFFVFTLLKVAGDPQHRADIGAVVAGSPAALAGVQPEDRIVEVEGTPTLTWVDVGEALALADQTVDLVVDRFGERKGIAIPGGVRDAYDLGLDDDAPNGAVGVDSPASPAGKAGVANGDTILAVEGTEVRNWNEVSRLALTAGQTVNLRLKTGTTERAVTLHADPAWPGGDVFEADDALWRRWGLVSAEVVVGDFDGAATAATDAGVLTGDRMIAVDGAPVRSFDDVIRAVASSASGEGRAMSARGMTLRVRRAGSIKDFSVTPRVVEEANRLGRLSSRPVLGIPTAAHFVLPPQVPRPYPFTEAVKRATVETTGLGGFMVEQIGLMITGEARVQDNLGGPVAMFRQTREAAEQGVYEIARLLGIFSLSLGIINLFPMPVLDGGQIVMYLAEWVRGRPLPLLLRERAQQAGVIFLVLLMLFVFANDIKRWVTGA